jgi:NAD(P)H-hydrate epimerase
MTTPEVLSVAQVRASEALTMSEEPISSLDLMERAGIRFTEYLLQHCPIDRFAEIVVVCGPGNNGGDGLVIARHLSAQGLPVRVLLAVPDGARTTPEFDTNLERWYALSEEQRTQRTNVYKEGEDLVRGRPILLIDAIFGIGLSKPLRDYHARLVENINQSGAYIIAVDAPSGMKLDEHTEDKALSIKAQETYTFQFCKLAYLLPENYSRCGEVSVIDIGLLRPEDDYKLQLIEQETIKHLLHHPYKYAHKGSMGHGLLITGSADMPGAAILAATAALRGGIGKVTVHSPSKVCDLLPTAIPEAILSRDTNEESFSRIDLERHPGINAIAIGCGLGKSKAVVQGLKNVLDEVGNPLILDADALNILAENKTWLGFLPAKSILTPHIKEFERMAGKADNDFDRIGKLRQFAEKYEVIVVLKGAHTAVAMPDGRVFFNTTGNPGMATAGSGDVLTGLLLALLSQGYAPEAAALVGVYLHGAAADCATAQHGHPTALIASDIPKCFGKAIQLIVNN